MLLTPAIPDSWEAEVGGLPGKKPETLFEKTNKRQG
jgi:hypothetical protein